MMGTSRIINREQIEANRKGEKEILDWLYPDRISDNERNQLLNEVAERRKHEINNRD